MPKKSEKEHNRTPQPPGPLTDQSNDTGASSLEYIGVILLCVLVVSAIIVAISPAHLTETTRAALCRIITAGGGDCDSFSSAEPPDCVLAQHQKNEKFELAATMYTFFDASVSAPIGLSKVVMSDGTVELVETIGVGVGVGVSAGKKIGQEGPGAMNGAIGTEAGAEAKIGTELALEGGSHFTFPSEEAANQWLLEKRNIHAQYYWRNQTPPSTGDNPVPEHQYAPTKSERILRGSLQIEATASANVDVSAAIEQISAFMKNDSDSDSGMAEGAKATLKVALEASAGRTATVQITGKGEDTTYTLEIDGSMAAGVSAEASAQTGGVLALGASAKGGASIEDGSTMILSFDSSGRPLDYTQQWSTAKGLEGTAGVSAEIPTKDASNNSPLHNGEKHFENSNEIGISKKRQVVETRTITFDTPEQQEAAQKAILHPMAGAKFAQSVATAGTQRFGTSKDSSGEDLKSSPFYEYLSQHPQLHSLEPRNFSDAREYYDLWENENKGGLDLWVVSGQHEQMFSNSQIVDAEYLTAPDSQGRRVWAPNLECMTHAP